MNRLSKFLDENALLFAPACFVIILLLLLTVSVKAATVLFPSGGGTGSSVAPTLGKIPVGTSGGVYAPTSTISGPVTVTGTSTLATTTTASLNGVIVVDGVHYAGNTSGIQSAEDTCNSAGGGSVYIPTGKYTISNINMRSNCPIYGAGTSTVLNITGFFGMKFSAVSGTGLYNIHLDGAAQSAQGQFAKEVEIVNSPDINLDHVIGTNAYGFGVFTEATPGATTTRVSITNSHFEGLGNNDVYGGGPACTPLRPKCNHSSE